MHVCIPSTHLFVNVREMLHGYCVDILVSPHPLLVIDQPVLEQPQSLVGPDPHQTLDGEALQRLEGLIDALDPASHFSRAVDVVRLHLLGESLLGGEGEREGRREGRREGEREGRREGEREGREGGQEGGRYWEEEGKGEVEENTMERERELK